MISQQRDRLASESTEQRNCLGVEIGRSAVAMVFNSQSKKSPLNDNVHCVLGAVLESSYIHM